MHRYIRQLAIRCEYITALCDVRAIYRQSQTLNITADYGSPLPVLVHITLGCRNLW